MAAPVALNESGLPVGGAMSSSSGSFFLPVMWNLPAPLPTLTIPDATVTAASLDGSNTNSALPLVYGAIKPSAIKKCTLQFNSLTSGYQTLTVIDTSSLGGFSGKLKVYVK